MKTLISGCGALEKYRERLFAETKKILAEDKYLARPFEGVLHITIPGFFNRNANRVILELDSHVFSFGSSVSWTGKTLEEAVKKADADLTKWVTYE